MGEGAKVLRHLVFAACSAMWTAEVLVSELSRRSGVSVPTIKFYLREGLLPPGTATSRTRATYGDEHLARLRLIRALLDVGGLTLATARSVIAVMEAGELDPDDVVRQALYALGPEPAGDEAALHDARTEVLALVHQLGWAVDPAAPAIDQLAQALVVLRGSYPGAPVDVLAPYAEAAHAIADSEFERRPQDLDQAGLVEWAVTGTVVFESVIAAWRRLAHEDLARGG